MALLQVQPQFADKCDWSKLRGVDWSDLLMEQPQFADKCDWSKLRVVDWIGTGPEPGLLTVQPRFADKFDKWGAVDGYGWLFLLQAQPQFADKCDWAKLDGENWIYLLVAQPQLADRCDKWKDFTAAEWIGLLVDRPEFADRCDKWKEMSEEKDAIASWCWDALWDAQPRLVVQHAADLLHPNEWACILCGHPDLASRFTRWNEIGKEFWDTLLRSQPQFADKRPR